MQYSSFDRILDEVILYCFHIIILAPSKYIQEVFRVAEGAVNKELFEEEK